MFCLRRNNTHIQIQQNMCKHLEFIMRNPHHERDYQQATLADWNRNAGFDWVVNEPVYKQAALFQENAGSVQQLETWLMTRLQNNPVLTALIMKWANQSCWLEPSKIVKDAYILKNIQLSDDLNTSIEQPKDKLSIISLDRQNGLRVNLMKYFTSFTDGRNAAARQVHLERAVELSIAFTVYANGHKPTVRDFNLAINYLPALLPPLPSSDEMLRSYFLQSPPGVMASQSTRGCSIFSSCWPHTKVAPTAPPPTQSSTAIGVRRPTFVPGVNGDDGDDSQI